MHNLLLSKCRFPAFGELEPPSIARASTTMTLKTNRTLKWLDIDYMNLYRDFEMDPNTFGVEAGQEFLGRLHENHQHWIPIVDSAIYIPNPDNATDAYPIYTRGNDTGCFMNNPNGTQYIGSVWPGYTVFPDWLSAGTVDWWSNEMLLWHSNVSFDGIWIDMSEVCGCHPPQINRPSLTDTTWRQGLILLRWLMWNRKFISESCTSSIQATRRSREPCIGLSRGVQSYQCHRGIIRSISLINTICGHRNSDHRR
jgi:hypothetical protein